MLRAFIVLMVAMFVGAMIYNSLQNALPKLFSEQVQGLLGGGAQGAGNLFALVFARSEEHTSELQSLMRLSYAGFCLEKKTKPKKCIHSLDIRKTITIQT